MGAACQCFLGSVKIRLNRVYSTGWGCWWRQGCPAKDQGDLEESFTGSFVFVCICFLNFVFCCFICLSYTMLYPDRRDSDNVALFEGQLTLEPKMICHRLMSCKSWLSQGMSKADCSLSCPGQCHWMWKQSFAQKLEFYNMQDLRHERTLTSFVSFASMRDLMHVWHARGVM